MGASKLTPCVLMMLMVMMIMMTARLEHAKVRLSGYHDPLLQELELCAIMDECASGADED